MLSAHVAGSESTGMLGVQMRRGPVILNPVTRNALPLPDFAQLWLFSMTVL